MWLLSLIWGVWTWTALRSLFGVEVSQYHTLAT